MDLERLSNAVAEAAARERERQKCDAADKFRQRQQYERRQWQRGIVLTLLYRLNRNQRLTAHECELLSGKCAAVFVELGRELIKEDRDFVAQNRLALVVNRDDIYETAKAAWILVCAATDQDTTLLTREFLRLRDLGDGFLDSVCYRIGDALDYLLSDFPGVPWTPQFRSIERFALAVAGLDGFSEKSIRQKLETGELQADPPWEKGSRIPHHFRHTIAGQQKSILAKIRENRLTGELDTLRQEASVSDESASSGSPD